MQLMITRLESGWHYACCQPEVNCAVYYFRCCFCYRFVCCVQLAAEVAAPLAKTDQMVILGSQDGVAGEITKLIGQLPPAVQALTGVDLSGVSVVCVCVCVCGVCVCVCVCMLWCE